MLDSKNKLSIISQLIYIKIGYLSVLFLISSPFLSFILEKDACSCTLPIKVSVMEATRSVGRANYYYSKTNCLNDILSIMRRIKAIGRKWKWKKEKKKKKPSVLKWEASSIATAMIRQTFDSASFSISFLRRWDDNETTRLSYSLCYLRLTFGRCVGKTMAHFSTFHMPHHPRVESTSTVVSDSLFSLPSSLTPLSFFLPFSSLVLFELV